MKALLTFVAILVASFLLCLTILAPWGSERGQSTLLNEEFQSDELDAAPIATIPLANHSDRPDLQQGGPGILQSAELLTRSLAEGSAQSAVGDAFISSPVYVSPELEALAQGPMAALHAELEREPIDDEWSYPMESNLWNYFSRVSGTVRIPAVTCRKTMCEVQALWNGSRQEWLSLVSAVPSEPWASDLRTHGIEIRNADDQLRILWYLKRESNAD